MSPIFVRPVREQLEHDRLIRHLHQKYRRRFEVAVNAGDEQTALIKVGAVTVFPDLVLSSGRKLAGTVEVETGESVNNLEAMAQWVHLSRARVPFHLYVPVHMFEAARRLCEANQARVGELWTYRPVVEGFDSVRMFADPTVRPSRTQPAKSVAPAKKATRSASGRSPGQARKAAKSRRTSAARPSRKATRSASAAKTAVGRARGVAGRRRR